MTEAPEVPAGYRRREDGVLVHTNEFIRRQHVSEAVWFSDGHGERFGCTTRVFSDGRDMTGHSCGKTAKHDPDWQGNPTKCGIHSAAAEAKRKAKFEAKYAEDRAKWAREAAQSRLESEAATIIRQIADGHNDPRALCAEWVQKWKETE